MFDKLYWALIFLILSCLLEAENWEKFRLCLRQVLHRISSYSGKSELNLGRGRSCEWGTLRDSLLPFFFLACFLMAKILIFLFFPWLLIAGSYAGGLGFGGIFTFSRPESFARDASLIISSGLCSLKLFESECDFFISVNLFFGSTNPEEPGVGALITKFWF